MKAAGMRTIQRAARIAGVAFLGSSLAAAPAFAKKERAGKEWFVQPTIQATQAVQTVRQNLDRITIGAAWSKYGKRGDLKIEAPLLLDNQVIGRIAVDPTNGAILPKGFSLNRPLASSTPQAPAIGPAPATEAAQKALSAVTVGGYALLAKHGESWNVPLVLNGAVVADVKVDSRTGAIATNWKAARDAVRFGRVSPRPEQPLPPR